MKRGGPLQRRTPMSHGKGFQRPEIERAPLQANRITRACSAAVISSTAAPVLKDRPVRSETYRRLVASLPCILCGVEGFTQHAHGNTGKGMALKVCDLFAFPLCADRPGTVGCHTQLDQGALFARAPRRVIEQEWARRTVLHLHSAGLLPAGISLPDWAQA